MDTQEQADKIRKLLESSQQNLSFAQASIDEALRLLPPPVPDIYTIKAGENLQSYLDRGGEYNLEAGVSFAAQGFLFSKPITLHGDNNKLIGTVKPAVEIPSGTNSVNLFGIEGQSANAIVFLLGYNDTRQTTLESVPSNINLVKCGVDKHVGKRGFEINSRSTVLKSCYVNEVNDPNNNDNQAICILNTPGNITVDTGKFVAATENILVGGDKKKIPGVFTEYLLFQNLELTRPIEWFTDGVNRSYKNILELKDGSHVVIDNCDLNNIWQDGQMGEAFMFTPSSGKIHDLLVKNCRVKNCGSVINMRGFDKSQVWTGRSSNIIFDGIDAVVESKIYGGRGLFALMDSPLDVSIINSTCKNDGSSLVYQTGQQMDNFVMKNSKGNCNSYGLNFGGGANGNLMAQGTKAWAVDGNTFVNSKADMKKNFPNNFYQLSW
jgi:hypothetical protein